ncbi:hypothetical protein EV401DRAFT_641816 [Pisolithus croceorrhizus]|nr:hypothetical protein EV401DRAFT_641816 [Pisolithus croceorrhizus]
MATKTSLHPYPRLIPRILGSYTAVTWHPIHPILVSGGLDGAALRWDLSGPEPSSSSTSPFSFTTHGPRATLSQARDSNMCCFAFHPLGHILVAASNDHTTRFWSRERPGDVTSVFSGGGEKPPEAVDMSGQDEDEEVMVPGFNYGGGTNAGGFGNSFAAAAATAGGNGMAKLWEGNDTDGMSYSTANSNHLDLRRTLVYPSRVMTAWTRMTLYLGLGRLNTLMQQLLVN